MSLRPIAETDLELILEWRNHPDVRLSMFNSKIILLEDHRAWFAKVSTEKSSSWFIFNDENESPVGVISFTNHSVVNRNIFWGFYTAPNATPGTGTKLGIEALDYAFNSLNLLKVNGEVLSTNPRSIAFHKKLGFSQEGLFIKNHFDGENFIDVLRLGIFEDGWKKQRTKLLQGKT